MNGSPSHKFTGAFVLGAIALVVAGLLVFGSGRLFQARVPAVMYFKESVGGLDVGAPVTFNGVRVGVVSDVDLVWNVEDTSFFIQVLVDLLPEAIQYRGASEELIEDLRRGETGEANLIERGLRAQLGISSLLTGKLQINLVMRPGTNVDFRTAEPLAGNVTEIPTIPSDIAEAQETLRNVMARLPDIIQNLDQTLAGLRETLETAEVDATLAEMRDTLAEARALFAAAEARVGPLSESALSTSQAAGAAAAEAEKLFAESRQAVTKLDPLLQDARDAIARAEALLATVEETVEPGSPLYQELVAALRQVSEAARAMRSLADTLERNPNSILFGR